MLFVDTLLRQEIVYTVSIELSITVCIDGIELFVIVMLIFIIVMLFLIIVMPVFIIVMLFLIIVMRVFIIVMLFLIVIVPDFLILFIFLFLVIFLFFIIIADAIVRDLSGCRYWSSSVSVFCCLFMINE